MFAKFDKSFFGPVTMKSYLEAKKIKYFISNLLNISHEVFFPLTYAFGKVNFSQTGWGFTTEAVYTWSVRLLLIEIKNELQSWEVERTHIFQSNNLLASQFVPPVHAIRPNVICFHRVGNCFFCSKGWSLYEWDNKVMACF